MTASVNTIKARPGPSEICGGGGVCSYIYVHKHDYLYIKHVHVIDISYTMHFAHAHKLNFQVIHSLL